MLGKLLSNSLHYQSSLTDVEFSVFSQFGDDGIIQYLVNEIHPEEKFFVEFGVENYLESNTRYLLQNNNWYGLIIDATKKNIDFIKQQDFYWRHDLKAVESFVTAENINVLLKDVPKNAGLLHIDIDGNDYWIWKAITGVVADIVIIEYNSIFGSDRAITVPYNPSFNRTQAHYSNLYAGASLTTLCDLAEEKGYVFIGSNSAGNNAYFIKKEKIGRLKPLSVKEGYIQSKFRESRDKQGQLTYLSGNERFSEIKGMQVYNTRTNQLELL